MRFLKAIRYSAMGVFFAGIVSAIQGCQLPELLTACRENSEACAVIIALLFLQFCPRLVEEELVMVTLTVAATNVMGGIGDGKVIDSTGLLIDCDISSNVTSSATGDCEEQVVKGTVIDLEATGPLNFTFDGWIDCDMPSGNDCEMTMDADKTVFADFGD